MTAGLLFNSDELVANWLFACYLQRRYSYDRAVGLVRNGELVGAVLFQGWNGANVEVSYYGKRDCNRNTAVRLVGFREAIERVARVEPTLEKAQ